MNNNDTKNLTMLDVARGVFWGNMLFAFVSGALWMILISLTIR